MHLEVNYMTIEDLKKQQELIASEIKKRKEYDRKKSFILKEGIVNISNGIKTSYEEIKKTETMLSEVFCLNDWSLNVDNYSDDGLIRFVNYEIGKNYEKNKYHDFTINEKYEVIEKDENVTKEEIQEIMDRISLKTLKQ